MRESEREEDRIGLVSPERGRSESFPCLEVAVRESLEGHFGHAGQLVAVARRSHCWPPVRLSAIPQRRVKLSDWERGAENLATRSETDEQANRRPVSVFEHRGLTDDP